VTKVLLNKTGDGKDSTMQSEGYRRLRQQQWDNDLKELQNNAAQRSGTRGIQARKELLAFEKEYALWQEKYITSRMMSLKG